MEKPIFEMLKQKNPDKNYPSNMGKFWSESEDDILLEELNSNVDINTIAYNHGRTIGGIEARRKLIAYKMHLKGDDIKEIMQKTKLDELQITEFISHKESYRKKNTVLKDQALEISELKEEIAGLKKDVREILRLIHEIYEFETQ